MPWASSFNFGIWGSPLRAMIQPYTYRSLNPKPLKPVSEYAGLHGSTCDGNTVMWVQVISASRGFSCGVVVIP